MSQAHHLVFRDSPLSSSKLDENRTPLPQKEIFQEILKLKILFCNFPAKTKTVVFLKKRKANREVNSRAW